MKTHRFKTYLFTSLSAAAVCLLAGCTDKFEEYNKDPMGLTPEQMLGDNVLMGEKIKNISAVLVQGQQNDSQMLDQMVGAEYGGFVACVNHWGNAGNFYTYNPRINWVGIPFEKMMSQIYTSFFKIKEETGGKGLVYAWAQLMRVVGALKLSDIYGPIPYFKVSKDSQQTAYDNMEDLYNHLFADLDAAVEVITTAVKAGEDFSSLKDFDYVYQGDFGKWVKFANTLKLRMALRLVNVRPELAEKKAAEALSHTLGLMTEVDDSAWSSFNDGMNPFYRAIFTWNGGEMVASANLTSYLQGYNDPRLTKYLASPENGTTGYAGVRNGIYHTQSSFATYQKYTKPNIGQDDKQLIMSVAEAYFLHAEYALRYNKGDAKALYEKGVQLSMAERGASIGNYLSETNGAADYVDPRNSSYNAAAPTAVSPRYNPSAAMDENLERIMIQKWLASFPNGWEAWADYRRTGYPKHFPVVDNRSTEGVMADRGMRRLPYPESERNTNKANYDAAVALLDGPDTGATELWWAKRY